MKGSMLKATFAKEADLCAAFIKALPDGWTAYPETAGFDVVLLREDGVQVGVEAKLTLNATVLIQAVDHVHQQWNGGVAGPDYLAVLIPYGRKTPEMANPLLLPCIGKEGSFETGNWPRPVHMPKMDGFILPRPTGCRYQIYRRKHHE